MRCTASVDKKACVAGRDKKLGVRQRFETLSLAMTLSQIVLFLILSRNVDEHKCSLENELSRYKSILDNLTYRLFHLMRCYYYGLKPGFQKSRARGNPLISAKPKPGFKQSANSVLGFVFLGCNQ